MNKLFEIKYRYKEYLALKVKKNLIYLTSKQSLKFNNDKNRVILTLLPTHGNLGDHAIAYASSKFFKDNFPKHEIIELDMFEIYKYGKYLKNNLKEGDFIVTIGGGNMNNLYMHEEWTRRFIINTFKNVPIISLPQTIAFQDNLKGRYELNKTKTQYSKNNNLTIFARENKSYNIMKKLFDTNRILLNPDMVFYLEGLQLDSEKKRDGILVCLRQDKEGYITLQQRKNIIENLKEVYGKVTVSDTVINKNVSVKTREKELFTLWEKFMSAEVVITDRLHGMIFGVITNTPTIVIRNSDHKITESYFWIKNLNYISLINDVNFDKIKDCINNLRELNVLTQTNLKETYFSNLKERIGLDFIE